MYLFQTNKENNIEVFELTPIKESIQKFKSEELAKVDSEKSFASHSTQAGASKLSKKAKSPVIRIKVGKDGEIGGLSWRDRLTLEGSSSARKTLSEEYVNGEIENDLANGFFMLQGEFNGAPTTEALYLMPTEPYQSAYKREEMDNILVITRGLFQMHALQTGRLDLLRDATEEEVDRLLKLYEVELVKTISWDSIKELSKMGLVQDAYKEALEAVTPSEAVLKLNKRS